jgi:integrase
VDVAWAKKPERLPIVLTREEVQQVLSHLSGEMLLIAQLLYGCGLRLTECLGLRVQDVDFGQRMIVVRDGKGQKDRTTTLPERSVPGLQKHLTAVQNLHHADLQKDYNGAARHQNRRGQSRHCQAGESPRLPPQLRYPFAGSGV